ncbi:MAG: ABC transporter permease, partial [Acidobacteriaceae bacterium]
MLRDMMWRLRALFGHGRLDAEMDEEIRAHLEREAEKYVRAGMPADEAGRRARIAFGGTQQVREDVREARGLSWLETAAQDLRYCGRMLRKTPGFTAVVVGTLALGIGACTAIFSLVSAVLMPRLPYGDVNRLVYLYTPNAHISGVPADVFTPANADFADLKRDSRSFASMTQFDQDSFRMGQAGTAATADGARVDGEFFATLDARPELGRTIDAADNEQGHDGVAVISNALWRQVYGGSRSVVGAPLELDGKAYRVIGVMPPGFHFPHKTDVDEGDASITESDVWIPLALTAKQRTDRQMTDASYYALARLKPGVSIEQAQAEMSAIMKRLDPLHPMFPFGTGWGAYVKPFRET